MKTKLTPIKTPVVRMVVNVFNARCDVDIRRPGIWGNPFIIGKDGTRQEVLDKYRVWITTSTDPKAEELRQKLPRLQGKVLGCCCKPKPCHGDVLLELISKL